MLVEVQAEFVLSIVWLLKIFWVNFHYWFSDFVQFTIPFVLLLTMNCVIIHTLCQRSNFNFTRSLGQSQTDGQDSKNKQNEKQIYIMLLLVTFGFLILTTPGYVSSIVQNFYHRDTPQFIAGFYLIYQIGEKTFYTNHGINFFFYVMSGQKFRTDLKKLLFLNRNSSRNEASTSRSAASMSTLQSDGN